MGCNSRVGVHHISGLLIYLVYRCLCLLFRCISARKIFQLFFHFCRDLIFTVLFQLFHQFAVFLCILSGNRIDQPFQIAGNQNIHRRRRGQHKFPVSVISSGLEEVKQYFVLIGSTDQLSDRNSHLFCIVCGKNIAEVSGRNRHIQFFPICDLFIFQQLGIGIYIINDLRDKTSDIDRIRRRKLVSCFRKLFLQFLIFKQRFHTTLCVVKITVDRNYRCIPSFLRYHLQFLHTADPVLRIKYDDLRSRNIRKSCKRGFPGISGSRRQDHDLIFYLIFLCCGSQKMRQDRQRHIFERDRRSMKQLQMISISHFYKRRDHFGIKLGIISTRNTAFQFLFRKICQKLFHHRIGGLLIRHRLQFFHRHIQLRDVHRHKQSPVFRQTFQDRFGSGRRMLCISCALV